MTVLVSPFRSRGSWLFLAVAMCFVSRSSSRRTTSFCVSRSATVILFSCSSEFICRMLLLASRAASSSCSRCSRSTVFWRSQRSSFLSQFSSSFDSGDDDRGMLNSCRNASSGVVVRGDLGHFCSRESRVPRSL